jgi:hypothetical protein
MTTLLTFLSLLQNPDTLNIYPMESLCMMTQGIFSQELETMIREAVSERGVKVYILAAPEHVQAPSSYIPALSLLDGVYVKLIQHDQEFMIQDAVTVFSEASYDGLSLYNYFLEQWRGGTEYQFFQ